MTISEVRNLARLIALWSNNTTQVSDSNALQFMNIVYHDMENRIVSKVREDFFFETWKADTVVSQSEYSLPTITWSNPGLKKILSVSVKYLSTDTFYKKLTREKFGTNDKTTDFLETETTTTNPFFRIADQSIFIYPTPTEAIVNGLMIEWIRELPDLLEADASSLTAIKIPTNYHRVLAMGMVEYIYLMRQLREEATIARQRYEESISEMLFDLWDRYTSAERSKLPFTYNWE